MKILILGLMLALSWDMQAQKKLFTGRVDVVSFTYRKKFETDVSSTLDEIKRKGITDIEFSNLFGKSSAELRATLDEKKMTCSSFGVSYSDCMLKTEEVAANAKTLGAKFVRISSVPHKDTLRLEEAEKTIEEFNRVGKILKEKHGLTFIYHNHGFEFRKYGNGTLYDLIMEKTDPKFVSFELDILWAFFPGQDPARLLSKYGSRYKAIHLKNLKKGITGNMSGTTDQENDVALGDGQIDVRSVIIAAKRAGIEHYYIEDESSRIDTQVPASIAYLRGLVE